MTRIEELQKELEKIDLALHRLEFIRKWTTLKEETYKEEKDLLENRKADHECQLEQEQ